MGGSNKQLMELDGRPVLARTLGAFEAAPLINGIVLVGAPALLSLYSKLVRDWGCHKMVSVVPGGINRQQSVYQGLLAVPFGCEIVLVHDGARPLVSLEEIEKVINAARLYGAATCAVPVKDTIKEEDGAGFVLRTPDRSRLWLTQTPQGFSYPLLLGAHRQVRQGPSEATDDAMLLESQGFKVKLVRGSYSNIKITTPEDIAVAACMLGEIT